MKPPYREVDQTNDIYIGTMIPISQNTVYRALRSWRSSILLLPLLLTACDTTPEPIEIQRPNTYTDDYYAALRAFKQS